MKLIGVIMRKEIRDAVRSRWMAVFATTFGVLALVLSFVQSSSDKVSVQGFNRTTAALVNLSLLLVPLLAFVVGAGSIAGERERGTLPLLMSMPISIPQLFLGKFVGLIVAVAATIAIGFGGAGIIVAVINPITGIGHYLMYVALSAVLAAAILSIGILVSVVSDSRLKALSRAMILWFVMVVLYDLAAVGFALSISASGRTLLVAVLANPVECVRILLIMILEPDAEVLGPLGSYVINEVGQGVSIGLLATALLFWTIVPLVGAISIASKQDA